MNSVQIGKTTYEIISDSIGAQGQRVLELQKANTRKTLIQGAHTSGWSLWSGRVGLPKPVEPVFSESVPQPEPVSITPLEMKVEVFFASALGKAIRLRLDAMAKLAPLSSDALGIAAIAQLEHEAELLEKFLTRDSGTEYLREQIMLRTYEKFRA